MRVSVACPACGRTSTISAEFARRELVCPGCKQAFVACTPSPLTRAPRPSPDTSFGLMCELAPAVFRLSVRPFLVAAMGGVCGIALIFMATETPVEDQFRITPSIRAPGAAPFRPQGHLVVRVLDKVVIDSWYDRVDVEADRNALLWLRFILGAGLGGYCGWVLGGGWAYATREV